MRVVLHSDDFFPRIGGIAAHVHGLGAALTDLGVDTTVVTSVAQPKRVTVDMEDGVRVLRLPPPRRPRFSRYRDYAMSNIANAFGASTLEPGTVIGHCHWHAPYWLDSTVPVFTQHSSMFLKDVNHGRTDKWRTRLKQYRQIITTGDLLRRETVKLDIDESRVTYIHNGVDIERFKPSPELRKSAREKYGIDDDAIVVLCAKRCVVVAGVIDFAHGLRDLERSLGPELASKVQIVFAGNRSPARDVYEEEAIHAFGRSESGKRAKLLGEVPNSDMPAVFAMSDISVLPSLKEATSISGLESMACGVPIVGTDIGGIPDLVDDETDGLLVEPGNPTRLGEAIGRFVRDSGLRQTFSERVRQKVVDSFTWESVARRTVAIYEKAMACATT